MPRLSALGSDRGLYFVVAALLAISMLDTCTAEAQPLPPVSGECAPELTTNRRAQIVHNGNEGMWFAMPVARCILERLTALPLYAERVSLLETRLTLSDRLVSIVREQAALATREADSASQALEAAIRRAHSAEEDRDRWYRSPAFLISVGVTVVIAIEVAVVLVLREVG